MTIKAIETRYNGRRFRSRLEARWAVFFDTLRLDWEYEKEGFDLGELGYYLPDFWVSNLYDRYGRKGMFVEVKGQSATDLEIEKLAQLVKHNGRYAAMLDGGLKPYDQFGNTNEFQEISWHNGEIGIDNPMVFMMCYLCGTVKYEFPEQNYQVCQRCGNYADDEHPHVQKAYEKALSARFEFGESG